MATAAQHVPAFSPAARDDAATPVASRSWRHLAAEITLLLGLFAVCAAIVALRMLILPQELVPRGVAFAAVAGTVVAAFAAFAGSRALRR